MVNLLNLMQEQKFFAKPSFNIFPDVFIKQTLLVICFFLKLIS